MIINRSIKVSGGTEITDGIVVKARDSEGYATEVDFYGSVIEYAQFYGGSKYSAAAMTPFIKLQKINTKNAVTEIKGFGLSNLPELTTDGLDLSHVLTLDGMGAGTGKNAAAFELFLPVCTAIGSNSLNGGGVTKAIFPELTSIGNDAFNGCSRLQEAFLPKIRQLGVYTSRMFRNCTALKTLEVGSVGFGVTGWGSANFEGCTQAGLTITMYTTGEKADALLSDIRGGATNATIILKASEDTTYNDVSYTAGEVMITSRVEISFSILDEETSESLGTFTVNGGTAFAEWIGSGLTLDSGLMLICSGADNSGPVMDAEGIYSLRYGGAAVNGTDAIVSGADYTLHNDYA